MSFQRSLPKDAFDAVPTRLQLPRSGRWKAVAVPEVNAIIDAHPGGEWKENGYVVDGQPILLADHPNFPPSYLARIAEISDEQRIEAAAQWLMADDTSYAAEPDFARRAARHMLKAARVLTHPLTPQS